MSTPANGSHIASWGGVIAYAPVGKNYTSSDFDKWDFLDYAALKITRVSENKDLICSGQLGSTTSRQVGYRNLIEFSVIWQYDSPPDVLLKPMAGLQAVFFNGDTTSYLAMRVTQDYQPYYWTPTMNIDTATPIYDANGKKMIRQAVTAHTKHHVFLCPNEGKMDDPSTRAGAYYSAYVKGNIIL